MAFTLIPRRALFTAPCSLLSSMPLATMPSPRGGGDDCGKCVGARVRSVCVVERVTALCTKPHGVRAVQVDAEEGTCNCCRRNAGRLLRGSVLEPCLGGCGIPVASRLLGHRRRCLPDHRMAVTRGLKAHSRAEGGVWAGAFGLDPVGCRISLRTPLLPLLWEGNEGHPASVQPPHTCPGPALCGCPCRCPCAPRPCG